MLFASPGCRRRKLSEIEFTRFVDGFEESAGEELEKIVFILECHGDDSQVGGERSGLLRKVL